ncbi:helix-hairpin-helix domain-containing protein [Spirulina major]|uniref:helix-hairpin-helix domain-containing protein n=1 Tax=Spirulina major TaxID=270636 RepID=UPI000934D634|nr:helix-hairpin-helix domain-containing protein [Spirulina major]
MKLKISLVGVKRIQSAVARSHFSPAVIDQAAEAILQAEGLINPLILRRLDWQSYEVVDNHLGYYAAVRAKELDLARGETVQGIILEPEQEAALLTQVQLFRGAVLAPEAVIADPPTAPDLTDRFAQFERTIAAQFAALRDENQHLRQAIETIRDQVTTPPPITLDDGALGAIAAKLIPFLPTVQPATSGHTSISKPSFSRPPSLPKTTPKINLNCATAVELCQVKGLGKSKAEAILKRRQEQGDFTFIDQLADLPGITQNTIQKYQWSDLFEV